MGSCAGPNLTSRSLDFYLDPGNIASYSGTGLTVNNLLGGTGATLVNGPTYTSSNVGYFTLDGSNDYLNITLSSLSEYTIDFWIYIISYDNTERQILGTTGDIVGLSLVNNKFHIWNGALPSNVANTTFSTGVWYYAAYTRVGSSTIIYLNGNVDGTFSTGNTISAGTANIGQIANFRNLNARITNFKIYTRALSDVEIKRNYFATKGRFGL